MTSVADLARSTPWRWSGLTAVATLWTTVGVGMALTGLGFLDERPISHLGTVSETIPLFRAGLLVAAALLAAFSVFARRAFSVPVPFLVASLVGLVGQVVVALVPISAPGLAGTAHTVGGLVLGASLPLLIWRFAAAQPEGRWRTVAYRLFWLELAACIAGVVLSQAG